MASFTYTAVLMVCGMVAALIVGVGSSLFGVSRHPMLGMGGMGDDSESMTIHTPDGSISINTSQMQAAAKKMEEASKRMETAHASGDPAAVGKAMSDMMGAMSGGAAYATDTMKAWLPAALVGQARTNFEVQGGAAMGIAGSVAKASYGADSGQMRLTITDAGGMGAMMGMAAWANMTVDKETATSVEKVYKEGQHTLREDYQKDGSRAEVTAVLGNGLMVELKADHLPMETVKKALAELDLSQMESTQRPAVKP